MEFFLNRVGVVSGFRSIELGVLKDIVLINNAGDVEDGNICLFTTSVDDFGITVDYVADLVVVIVNRDFWSIETIEIVFDDLSADLTGRPEAICASGRFAFGDLSIFVETCVEIGSCVIVRERCRVDKAEKQRGQKVDADASNEDKASLPPLDSFD